VEKLIFIIYRLARRARLQLGLGHKALQTIYEGAIVPLQTYGATIWEKEIRNNRNLTKYKRVKRLTNIKIAKVYRTVSYEVSCVIAGLRQLQITIEQPVQTYTATKINKTYDAPMDVRYWRHPAELPTIREVENGTTYAAEVYKDGSKVGDNVGAAGIIFVNGKLVHQLKFKLHAHCSNNQAEQVAILKALEQLEELQKGQDNERRAAMYTDSKITLDLLQNKSKRNYLIECIRNKIIELTPSKWTIHFRWVKGDSGIEGNELADRLARAAAVEDEPVIYEKIPREVIVTRAKENGLKQWQHQSTSTGKGAVTKSFFPFSEEQNTTGTSCVPRVPIYGNGTREMKIILPWIWNNR